jgi:hypothetical protein
MAVIGLGILTYFDLGPALAFNDDWIYAWSTAHLSLLAPRIHPFQSAEALVQLSVGYLVGLGHADQRLLRLTELPFVALAALCSAGLARRLGAGSVWAAVAGLGLLATPLYLTLATSYMSDVPFVALLLAACLAGATWISEGRLRAWCVGLTALATLQRQVGLAVPAALTLTLLLQARGRGLPRRDLVGLSCLWLASLAAVALPSLMGLSPPVQGQFLSGLSSLDPAHQVGALKYAPAAIGLCLVPFLPALLAIPRPRPLDWLLGAALVGAILAVLLHLRFRDPGLGVFPGNVWTPSGFTPTSILGSKPSPFPSRLYLLVEIAAVATGAALAWRWRDWIPRSLGGPELFLGLTALTQLAFILLNPIHVLDRYYLPVAAPLVPLAALAASRARWQPAVAGGALAIAAAGLAIYAVGEQDYEAWQEARDRAARVAYAQAPPEEVRAGYEANGVYALGPALEAGKGRPANLESERELVRGPEQAALALEYSSSRDARPGVSYRSVASGRIVILPPDQR